MTEEGGAFSPPIQVCQPLSNEDSTDENPLDREAAASLTAADWVLSKASASVNVVLPLALTGISAVWSMWPLLETPVYCVERTWPLRSWLDPLLEVPT